MGRSRQLVSHRWAKTFGTFLVLAIIVLIASLIFSAITAPLGIIMAQSSTASFQHSTNHYSRYLQESHSLLQARCRRYQP
jgi:hypothetical protein